MTRKQVVTLLVLVIVLGGLGLLLRKRSDSIYQNSGASAGKNLLADLPVNDIAHIVIKQGPGEVNLVKKEDLWRVRERNDYPANYSEISEFLLKARDLKIVETEKVGPSQLPRLELAAGSGTNSPLTVEFKDKGDKTIRSMVLGKKRMRKSSRPSPMGDMGEEGWPEGRYVKTGTDSDTVALISEPFANIQPKPEDWLNKDFVKVERVRAITLVSPVATNSWKVARETETGEWKLADAKAGEQLDSSKASGLANPLSSPSFVDVAPEAKASEAGIDKGTTVTLDTFDNFTYTLKVGQKTNDNLPVTLAVAAQLAKERPAVKDEKPEDKARLDKEFAEKQKKLDEKLAQEKGYEKWVFFLSNWTLDPLLKDRAQLMAEKKEEPKKEEKADAGSILPTETSTNPPPSKVDTNSSVPAKPQ